MTSEIIVKQASVLRSYDDIERAAKAMSASGFFQDSRQAGQAVVKILAGQELGFGPFASMNGVHIIQGKPAISANMMAAAVKNSGRYDYRVLEMTDSNCRLEFFQGGKSLGVTEFSAKDAAKAGTKNMDKFPRNMLFARAMSNGVRWFCPDVMNGSAVYTPEELGADVDEEGTPIMGQSRPFVVDADPFENKPLLKGAAEAMENLGGAPLVFDDTLPEISLTEAMNVTNSEGVLYGNIDTQKLFYMARSLRKLVTAGTATDEHKLKLSAAQTIIFDRQSREADEA